MKTDSRSDKWQYLRKQPVFQDKEKEELANIISFTENFLHCVQIVAALPFLIECVSLVVSIKAMKSSNLKMRMKTQKKLKLS